jgi:hypothetical protein
MSMHRAFPSTPVVGTQHSSAKVACSKCDAAAEITTQTGARRLPPDAIARKFRTRGWHIGHTAAKDRCPDCNGTPPPKHHQEETMGMHNENTVVEIRAPRPGASDQAPREMTREDRRIIFAKLEEVYVDEATGYTKGWNDAAVASDLNCPRAWVETIRDENFGPQKAEQSAEVIELRGKIDFLLRADSELAQEAGRIAKTAEDARIAASDIESRALALHKKVEALSADLKKLAGGR